MYQEITKKYVNGNYYIIYYNFSKMEHTEATSMYESSVAYIAQDKNECSN